MTIHSPTLAQVLQAVTLTTRYNGTPGLRELADHAKIENSKYAKKAELIPQLLTYYETAFSPANAYAQLSQPEQALATHLVRTGGYIAWDEFYEIVRLHKWPRLGQHSNYFNGPGSAVRIADYIAPDSPFWLLFPGEMVPEPYRVQLLELVGETPRGEPVKALPADAQVFAREAQLGDFQTLVRYCNRGSFALTKGGLPSKSAAVGFCKEAGYRELTDTFSENAADVRTVKKLRVTFPLYLTAMAAGLVCIKGTSAAPGKDAQKLLASPPEVFAKKLFEAYQASYQIEEIAYLPGIRERYSIIDYPTMRAYIVRQLCAYPVGEWIATADFINYLRMEDRFFLRKDDYDICYTGGTDYTCAWDEAEVPLIHFLQSVYGALGLLDLAWAPRLLPVPSADTVENIEQSVPVCFRITGLGAYVFGLKARYDAAVPQQNKLPGGFLVQPDFSLMLPESASRLGHELYLERFLTKVSTDAQMSVYRIDIDGILRLLNLGMTLAELLAYLEKGAENPLPDTVRRAFADWQEMAGKLRIRTVTILETDDPILLEEVVRYRGMEPLVQGRTAYGAVIRQADAKKVKAILEKNKRYCDNGKKR